MAKGKSAPVVQNTGVRTKAKKKNPGPAQMEKTNFTHVNGRTAASNAKREAWKAIGGREFNENIPHWKTGKLYKAPVFNNLIKTSV
jgi:hypothetical protein